ncbi:MAG: HDOD domain-containing protein [Candidatus Rokubacteria bacterium]|nr:HDOD domain-containing protein [Candidatus Rokubacteria bacterium]
MQPGSALAAVLADPGLKSLVSQMRSLPSLPSLYVRVLAECQSPRGSLKTVGEIIAEDVAMTAKILQMVNSSFFGLRGRVSSPVHGVQLLGLETVKALVLCAHVFSQFDDIKLGHFPIEVLWRHSLASSAFARLIAASEREEEAVVDMATVAAILHDVGQLVLASRVPDRYADVLALAHARGVPLADAEAETIGTTHAAVGAYLLGFWALPAPIPEAVAFHHTPWQAGGDRFSTVTAVHVADALADELAAGDVIPGPREIDTRYLDDLGLSDRLAVWRDGCARIAGE